MIGVLIRSSTETNAQGEGHRKTKAEIGMAPFNKPRHAKDYGQPSEAVKRQEKILPWSLIRKHGPADTLIFNF